MITHPLKLGGAYGSPYSVKMRAVLRYRRIPFTWVLRDSALDDLPPVPVRLIPVIAFPDGDGAYTEAMIDSSPLIDRLETMETARSLTPTDPVVAFLDRLVEDYADEWLTKAMFHYRWHYRDDIERAGDVLPRWRAITASEETIARLKQQFSERQISRLRYVGSSPETAPVIEDSYRRFVDSLDAHLRRHPFLMGARPGASDFGVFGQLTQLTHFDPTPMALTLARSPRVFAWVDLLEDLSGLPVTDEGWLPRAAMAEALRDLLAEVGRTYVPVMLANARALAQGADRVETDVEGRPWIQQPFAYQGKCVRWLRESWGRLADADRAALAPLLADTGCLRLFEG